ncbi:MAG: DUF3667 domain-containing protein [Cyclobacteriaceae bacterium]
MIQESGYTVCPNCQNEFAGEYCSQCGQEKISGRLTLKQVFTDFIQAVFLFDSRLYKTLLGLLLKPGRLTRSYFKGERGKHLPPFQFFLLLMTAYLLILSFFGEPFFDYINRGLQLEGDGTNNAMVIQNLVKRNLNILYFILAPIIALIIRMIFGKEKCNFAEALIFSFYIMGVFFFLSSIIILTGQFSEVLFAIKPLIIVGYFPFAIVQFTQSRSFVGVLKSILSIILSYSIFAVVVVALVSLYVFVFGAG